MKIDMKNTFRTLLLGSVAAASVAAPSFVYAQEVDVEELVVTGSRIRRDTFTAPVPVSVLSGEQIRASGNVSLAEAMLDIPTISANTNSQNSSSSLFLAGQARADIRGLGAERTLVLMDGRRIVFSDASSPGVDLNMIPSLMVERVETVAGGASAVYGSEAIAGVVNLIMKKEFEGFQFETQVGTSEEGDGETFRISGMYGTKLLDDRLNLLVGGEVSRQEPVMQRDRDWAFPGIRRNSLNKPQNIIPNSRSNSSPYATFQLGKTHAVAIDARDPSQIVRLSPACSTATVQPDCQDEALIYSNSYLALQGKSSRGTFRTFADYQLTDNIKVFGDVLYSRVEGYGYFQPAFSTPLGSGTMPLSFKGDNAFLQGSSQAASQLRAEWLAAGKTFTNDASANVGKFFNEFGGRDVKSVRETVRIVGGMQGEFEALERKFNWDWYAQYGETNGSTTSYNQPNVKRVQQATDAVFLGGQIVCRDESARANGCIPWNLVDGPTPAAVAWTNADSTTDQEVKQTVVAANITSELFQLPAGPVGVAIGGEYRKEESFFAQDALGASGALYINPVGTRQGEYDVVEGYGEVRLPLLKDVPFAKELSVELAGRLADYSSIGRTEQYRVLVEWAPVQDVRFRASQGTAVRAPNIVELYAPQSRNFNSTAQDPCDSANFAAATAEQQAARRITCAAAIANYNPATFESNFGNNRSSLALLQGGNPDLGPEEADTYNLGVVIQPRWIPNLQMSLDFFKYNLSDQISTVPVNTLLTDLCYDSSSAYASNPFCAQIKRDPTGANGGGVAGGVSEIVLLDQNVAKVKVEGYDASIQYGFRSAEMFNRDFGDFAFRVDATWMYRWALQGLPGEDYTQLANTITNATPEWKGQASVQWNFQNLGVTWTTHYIGSMIPTTSFQPSALDPFYTGDYYMHDLRVRYELNDQVVLRGGIQNLTDETPPYLPETYAGTSIGSSSFDNRGRFFFVGATLRY